MNNRKSIRFVFPDLQRRLLLGVLVCAGTSVILSTCISAVSLASLARELPNDGDLLMERTTSLLVWNMGIALVIALPAFALLACLISMPMMGVFHRLHAFLQDTVNGDQIRGCQLRDKDPMQDVARLLNQATEAQRERNRSADDAPSGQRSVA